MRVKISTELDCPPEMVWQMVRRPALLMHVAAPLLRFKPLDPPRLPEEWSEGRYLLALRLFGVLPMGRQLIVTSYERIDETPGSREYQIRDNGSGGLARKWDHLITIRQSAAGSTSYTDTVDIEAGGLTVFIWLFAHVFYRHRQRRWRNLAKKDLLNGII